MFWQGNLPKLYYNVNNGFQTHKDQTNKRLHLLFRLNLVVAQWLRVDHNSLFIYF